MQPVIRFHEISKSFGRLCVLDRVSFEVEAGQALCVLGRSGTGKSVLIKQLVGLIRPDAGQIYVNGEEITRLAPPELARVRRSIGFLFQYSALFDFLSVGENVAFPLRRHTRLSESEIRDRVAEKLRRVGLEGIETKMPAEISGGMRKRVGLARALALDPPVLLADEPSSGLDPLTSREIDELLLDLKLSEGVTMVVVTHNIPSARRIGDQLALLERGRILARGTAGELASSPHALVQEFMKSEGAM